MEVSQESKNVSLELFDTEAPKGDAPQRKSGEKREDWWPSEPTLTLQHCMVSRRNNTVK